MVLDQGFSKIGMHHNSCLKWLKMRGHWEVTLSIIALLEGLQKAMPCRKIRPFDKKWKFSIIPNVRPLVSWLVGVG